MAEYLDEDACEKYLESDEPLEGLSLTVAQGYEVMGALLAVGRGFHAMLSYFPGTNQAWVEAKMDTVRATFDLIQQAIHRQMHVRQGVPCRDPENVSVCLGKEQRGDPFAGEGWGRMDVGDHLK